MLLRNRRCKGALRNVLLVVIAFSCILSFSSLYDTSTMTTFIYVYGYLFAEFLLKIIDAYHCLGIFIVND
jgi:hypothetical protein